MRAAAWTLAGILAIAGPALALLVMAIAMFIGEWSPAQTELAGAN